MKKIYFLASVILASMSLQAQTHVNFEDLELESESYYNGSDGAGAFASEGVVFNNSYNSEFSYMQSGFAYSNMTDNTTAGYTNQYSAITGIGADDSPNYAINFGGDTLFLPLAQAALESVEITNTTYTYFSMKDGDDFSKQFGVNGDKDYLYVNIYGHLSNGDVVDTVTFYLADFRSDNPEEHYIINSWTTVDLTAFDNVNFLTFEYFSSDVGDYGINTPVYFALDNLIFDQNTTGLFTERIANFKIYPNPTTHNFTVEGNSGLYEVYNTMGAKVLSFESKHTTTVDVSGFTPGVYFIKNKATATTMKLIVK